MTTHPRRKQRHHTCLRRTENVTVHAVTGLQHNRVHKSLGCRAASRSCPGGNDRMYAPSASPVPYSPADARYRDLQTVAVSLGIRTTICICRALQEAKQSVSWAGKGCVTVMFSPMQTLLISLRQVRKTSRSYPEGYATDTSRSIDLRQQPSTAAQGHSSVQPPAQSHAPVGSASFQHYAPSIVSIRAGQGPEDPQTPILHGKPVGPGRPRDQQPSYPPSSGQAPPGNVSAQSHNVQQSKKRYSQPPANDDSVSRLHNVLGTVQQAPLPPLPHEAASQHRPSLDGARPGAQHVSATTGPAHPEYSSTRPSYTPPSGQLPQPTVTPKSMTQTLPNNATGRSHVASANTDYLQTRAAKRASGSSPGKLHGVQLDQSPAHIAKLSVYRSPGPAVSAEVVLPTTGTQLPDGSTQFVSFTQTTVQDLASKFPLNEDVLTSASSSTLAPGTGRSGALPALPDRSPQQQRRQSGEHFGQVDSRANASQPVGSFAPESFLSPNWAPAPGNPTKQANQRPFDENDVPIPIPAPRSMSTAPTGTAAQYYQGDSRSQKQTLPPIPGALQPASRPQPTPLQSRGAPTYGQQDNSYGQPCAAPRATRDSWQAAVPPNQLPASPLHPSNNSPSRSIQQITKGSPNGSNGIVLGNGTPKHSPSSRLAGRNGSTDTVYGGPGKSSPNNAAKAMAAQPNNTNNINLQHNVSSRPDTNARLMNATYEYPDNARYRPTAPAYPNSAPPQQTTYLPNSTVLPTNLAQPAAGAGHHSRSMSQPVVPVPPEVFAPPPRGQTVPMHSVSAVPGSTPATAPSASAIVAAYRSGLYGSEQSKIRDHTEQRAPPRSAPSPAPTLTGRPYGMPQSSLAKTGFAMPGAPAQANRGPTQPPPRPPTAQGPPAANLGTHNRSQSDPQFPTQTQPPRVAVSGHPSTPAPPKAQLAFHPSPSEQELLRTPSSLAPSMKSPLPPVRPSTVQPASAPKATKEKEPRRRGAGILGIFRSRSSPPKQDARTPVEPVKPRQRSSSQTTITAVAASVRNIIAPHPHPVQPPRAPPAQAPKSLPLVEPTTDDERPPKKATQVVPPAGSSLQPIVAPSPVRVTIPTGGDATVPGGRRSPGTKMFTPFRLLSRRHHTVSAASVEALDGTAVCVLQILP